MPNPTQSESAERIAVIPGDGIGIEVTREAVKILSAIGRVRAQKGRGLYVADDDGMLGSSRWGGFFLPTDLQADLLFDVDQYDGKALIDFIDPSLGRGFSFRVGDELISVDGKTVADWLKEFGKYNAFGNPRSTDRSST